MPNLIEVGQTKRTYVWKSAGKFVHYVAPCRRYVDANESARSNVERENNWIRLSGLSVQQTYWFQATARNARGNESPSKVEVYTLKLRTGMCLLMSIFCFTVISFVYLLSKYNIDGLLYTLFLKREALVIRTLERAHVRSGTFLVHGSDASSYDILILDDLITHVGNKETRILLRWVEIRAS